MLTPCVIMVCMIGCAQRRVEPWSPTPLVLWEDLCAYPIPQTENSYRMIKPEPTRGLFPASMAVTRIGIDQSTDMTPGIRPRMLTDPRNEFMQWHAALDDQMAISEVFPIRENDLGGRDLTMSLIFDASAALDARLALIYAVNDLGEDRTEILGVIYDTHSAHPLAVIHSEAMFSPIKGDGKDASSMWKTDPSALARARFDQLLHSCIIDLIIQDEPLPVAIPAGWPPPGRSKTAVWPPARKRSRP